MLGAALRDGTAGVPLSQLPDGAGEDGAEAARVRQWREVGLGAQILRDLGVGRMRLLGSPRRMPSMAGYGLEVTGFLADDGVAPDPAAAAPAVAPVAGVPHARR